MARRRAAGTNRTTPSSTTSTPPTQAIGHKIRGAGGCATGRLSTTAKNSTGPALMRPTTAKPGHAARCAISWPCSATGRSSPAASTARGASRSGTCWRSRSTKFLPLNLPAALPQASRCKNGSTRSAAAAAMRSAFDESVERTVKRLPCVRGGVLHHWIRASSLRR